MKEVKVLGPGCAKCQEMMEQTKTAIAELALECDLEKVTDIQKITAYGVMMTPALVVDGNVKVMGKVPPLEELKNYLTE